MFMELKTLVKRTREVGTSAGVLLPRKWLNKQVVVTLAPHSKEDISESVLKILFNQKLNEEIKGIYLFGSYARNEQDFDSDIDILVITEKINKIISQEGYEILLVSEETLQKNLSNNLFYQSILNEIKVIINKELIKKYSVKKYGSDFRKSLLEIKKILKINKESISICEEIGKNVPDGIVYSVVLRLRELYLIKAIHSKITYSKKEFIKIIGEKVYSAYIRIKRDEREMNNLHPKEIKKLLDLSEKWQD